MEQVPAFTVSPELLEVLGVQPLLGRNLDRQADHHEENGAFPSVLISHELWQRRYGGEGDILGRTIDVYNVGRQVAGVMPPGFRLLLGPGTGIDPHADVWIPAARDPSWQHVRAWKTVGRLKPGVTAEQARAELDAIGGRVRERHFPESSEETIFRVVPLRRDLASGVRQGVWILGVSRRRRRSVGHGPGSALPPRRAAAGRRRRPRRLGAGFRVRRLRRRRNSVRNDPRLAGRPAGHGCRRCCRRAVGSSADVGVAAC